MEDKDLNRCVTSLAGSEPLSTAPCSIGDARLEPTAGNSRNADLGSIGSPSSSRQGLWQYLDNGYSGKDSQGDSLFHENDQILLRVREEFAMQRMKRLSNKHNEQYPDKVSSYLRVNDDNKTISSNGLLIGKKQLKTISKSSFSQSLVKKALKGKGIITRYPEGHSVVLDQNGYDAEVASVADSKTSANNDQNRSNGILRSSPESYSNGISLREWLKSESRKVDKAESLLIFKQIVQLVEFAHSQGSSLQDLRPTCFTILPSNKIQYTGSLAMTNSENVVHRDLSEKRPLEQNASFNHSFQGKQLKLSDAVRSLRNQPKMGKETEFYMADSQIYGCRESQVHKDSSYRNTSIARQQQSITVIGQLEKKWYASPEGLEERGCTYASNVYGLGVILFEVRRCL